MPLKNVNNDDLINKQGFTLIEVLMTVAIIGIIATVAVSEFDWISR